MTMTKKDETMNKPKILLLEDDTNLSETVCEFLESKGYIVVPVYDGEEAETRIYEEPFDLLLLDVNVPSLNGFALLERVRNSGKSTPAIFLTSLNALEDLEQGYESGCDDYLRKPFALKELAIRIDTLLKREFFHAPKPLIRIDEGVEYNTLTNELLVQNRPIHLQNKEAKLLKLFLQKKSEIIYHETIMSALWDYDEQGSDETLRTYVKNLRKLLGKDRIVSVKKLGYKFTLA